MICFVYVTDARRSEVKKMEHDLYMQLLTMERKIDMLLQKIAPEAFEEKLEDQKGSKNK